MNKTCNKCGLSLGLEHFHRSQSGKFGRASYCRTCFSTIQKEWRERDILKSREKENSRSRNRRKLPEVRRKEKSRAAVRDAVRAGKVYKPTSCQRCGRGHCQIQAHHPNYNEPFNVEWLCASCHGQIHSGLRVEGRWRVRNAQLKGQP
jgi:hypothetical protein